MKEPLKIKTVKNIKFKKKGKSINKKTDSLQLIPS